MYVLFVVDSAVKRNLLKMRFNNYDKDNSYSLSVTEMSIFKVDFHEFTHCSEFISSQLFNIMDSNNDNYINIREWGNFFEGKVLYCKSLAHMMYFFLLQWKICPGESVVYWIDMQTGENSSTLCSNISISYLQNLYIQDNAKNLFIISMIPIFLFQICIIS